MRIQRGRYSQRIPDFVTDARSASQVSRLNEEQLDTSGWFNDKLAGVSRRDFMRIAKRWGLTSTYFAAGAMGGIFSAEALAQKTRSVYERRLGASKRSTP